MSRSSYAGTGLKIGGRTHQVPSQHTWVQFEINPAYAEG
jgi:hypothetical protein